MILSRGTPPPALFRFIASNHIALFPGEMLRLSLEESLQIAARMTPSGPPPDNERIRNLHAQTEGWAAGFTLSLFRQGKATISLPREDLFDYFAGELLDGLGPAMEGFLQRTACFPEFTAAMAYRLTGVRQAERILNNMVRNNLFTTSSATEAQVYRYHNLFRQWLLARAQDSFSAPELEGLQRRAATILREGEDLRKPAAGEILEEALHCEQRHWSIKIHTLGRFSVLRHGAPLAHGRKNQKRPLQLLQALIALGGRRIALHQLEDALWPEASGDHARRAFNSALYRLRKLIGHECLQLQEGKLTLNDRFCWVDVWMFERLLGKIEEALHAPLSSLPIAPAIEKILRLSCGPFLGDETEQTWMLAPRERLRNRMRRIFSKAGRQLGHLGLCEQAIALYGKALEIDPQAEEFYRKLMTCYAAQQRFPEALATYGSCRKTLRHYLCLEPSAATESLHLLIQRQDADLLGKICADCRSTG